jgi:hypothetical protein
MDNNVRLKYAFEQLIRYGHVHNNKIIDIIDRLTDINDDLHHGRHERLIVDNVNKIKSDLDAILKDIAGDEKALDIVLKDKSVIKNNTEIDKEVIACLIENRFKEAGTLADWPNFKPKKFVVGAKYWAGDLVTINGLVFMKNN